MVDERGVVREIAWREIFPWVSLVRAVRLALAPRMIFLAALGLVLTAVGWRLVGLAFPESAALLAQPTLDRTPDDLVLPPLGRAPTAPPAWPWQTQLFEASQLGFGHWASHPFLQPLVVSGEYLTRPFRGLFRVETGAAGFFYSLLCALWGLAVWSAIGGAITRIAALELARESRLGLVGGLRFGIAKWPAFFGGPLVPLLGVASLILIGFVTGLLMRIDFGAVVIGIGWPIMLGICFVIAILLIGLALGWPLMWPTIGAEATDSFDAISRSYSYLFQRPLQYLFYTFVAGLLGMLASIVVVLVAEVTMKLAFWAVSFGTGLPRIDELRTAASLPALQSGLLGTAGYVLAFWNGAVMLLATAFLYSYFWSAATGIYFLLRLSLDGMEPDEVAVDERSDETVYGLPPLTPDELGVPRVVDPPGGGPQQSPAPPRPHEPPLA